MSESSSSQMRAGGLGYTVLTVRGRTLKLRPFKFGVYGEMEGYYRSLLSNPIKEVAKVLGDIPEDQRAMWAKEAVAQVTDRVVTRRQLEEFQTTFAGVAFQYYVMLREDQPEFSSPEVTQEWLKNLEPHELAEAMLTMDVASGMAELKNSDGQTTPVETSPNPGSAAGQESTSSS